MVRSIVPIDLKQTLNKCYNAFSDTLKAKIGRLDNFYSIINVQISLKIVILVNLKAKWPKHRFPK